MNIVFTQPRVSYYVGGDELRCMRTLIEYSKKFKKDKIFLLTLKSPNSTFQYKEFLGLAKSIPNLNIIEISIPHLFRFDFKNKIQDPNKWHVESHAFCSESIKWISKNKCDIVWSFFISDMFVRPHNIPVLLNQSGYFCDDYTIRSTMFEMYDAVVCISGNVKKKWNERLPRPLRNSLVLNSSPMVDFNTKIITGTQFPKNNKNIEIIFVGRLISSKGIINLIQGFNIAFQAKKDIHLTIVGSGPEEQKIKDLVKELNLSSSISLVGEVSDTSSFYKKADIAILPSVSYEGFMNVVIESMFYGLCVISTTDNGNEDIIDSGVNGILISKPDPLIISKEILKLSSDIELSIKMGNSARKTILKKLSWDTTVSKMREIISKQILQYKND